MNWVKIFIVWTVTTSLFAAKGPATHQMGPTGIMGTVNKNVLTVTKVDKGSPADGKVKPKDQIMGVSGSKFKADLRKEMAAAIDTAESKNAGGKLTLTLKDGKTVDLQLTVLGSYSATAPYDCPKTDAIVARAADYLAKNKKWEGMNQDLIGLLATGEQRYIDVVKEAVHAVDKKSKKPMFEAPTPEFMKQLLAGETDAGYVTWSWGYTLIFLCEYYLMTKDEAVLPAIKAYSVVFAKGQDPGGLYGHRLATVKRNYRLPGYAQMNQPSLTVFMGMLLAQKCGVDDPALTEGVEKSHAYFDSFVGRGAFPYGVHGPKTNYYNNNGTSGSAAVCMSIKGNKDGATFFSTLAATAFNSLESGHTGHFFNVMWTPLGAGVGGPEVTKRFFENSRWLHTLYRKWDGSFSFDGGGYKRCSSTGSHLLTYCLPRRKLLITGKAADESIWLNPKEAADAVSLSVMDYDAKGDEELIALASTHRIPQVRRAAAAALGKRREKLEPTFVKLLKEGTSEQKAMASGLYGWWIPMEQKLPQLDALGAILRDPKEKLETKVAAAGSLAYLGEPANTYYMDMVKLLAEDRPDDRFGDVDWALGGLVAKACKTPFGSKLVTDKDLFYKAALKLIKNKRQHARADGLRMLADMPLEDFHLVADEVVNVIEDRDPTYHSYHSPGGPICAGIAILSHLNIKEGMDYAMGIMKIESGKGSFKMRAIMDSLAMYGANAKPYLEKLKQMENWKKVPGNKKLARNWNKMVKAIEGDKNPPKLISLEEAKKAAQK